jgi:hypothetical protein
MDLYDGFLMLLLCIKLIFVGAVVKTRIAPSDETTQVLHFTHYLFNGLMACLLIYLFRPRTANPVLVDRETKIFLFTFGILTGVDLYHALF